MRSARMLSFLAALLVAAAPLAVAGDEGTDDGADDRSDCAEHPDADGCRRDGRHGNGTSNTTGTGSNGTSDQTDDHPQGDDADEDHPDATEPDGTDGSPRPSGRPGAFPPLTNGRYVSFSPDRDNLTLRNYTVGDVLLLDRVQYRPGDDGLDDVEMHREGRAAVIEFDDDELWIHDNPTGQLAFRGDDGSILLDLPDGAVLQPGERGARVHLPGGGGAIVVAPHGTWIDDDLLVATGFLSIHLVPRDGRAAGGTTTPGDDDENGRLPSEVHDAIADRRVAAQVLLDRDRIRDRDVEIRSFDDVDVQVEAPGPGAPWFAKVIVDADLDEGRTIILDLDPAAVRGHQLLLRYFDVSDSGVETEVLFHQADSMTDVLDADDDNGTPEYHVFSDAGGLHAAVSIPSFSVHAILVEFVEQPAVLVGIAAGVAASAVAAVAMFWPRRRDA